MPEIQGRLLELGVERDLAQNIQRWGENTRFDRWLIREYGSEFGSAVETIRTELSKGGASVAAVVKKCLDDIAVFMSPDAIRFVDSIHVPSRRRPS